MLPKILLVVPRLNIGGAESYVYTLAMGLKGLGYPVITASWGGKLATLLEREGIPHYRIPVRLNPYFVSLMLERVIKKERVQLVHANSADAGAAVASVCGRLGLPWVMTAHGSFGREVKYRQIAEADRVICVSRYMQRETVQNTDIAPEKIVMVYNGIDTGRFAPKDRRAEVRGQLSLPEDAYVIGIVSRITGINGKGHDDLLQVMRRFSFAHNWRLLIVGKGKWRAVNELKEKIEALGLGQRVVFAGHHTDVSAVMEAMDVLALPSKWETFGLVLVEAMAMKKPVVAYDVAGTAEAVGQDGAGILVSLGDVDALAAALQTCADQTRRSEMGEAGRRRVLQNFDLRSMLQQITGIYHEILSEHGSSMKTWQEK
jgi:glycosyltransferase involved in cell wall biosynthesis